MTTKASGGKITGLLALTMETNQTLRVGDYVQMNDDYEVVIADGTAPVLGKVSVSNIRGRTATDTVITYGVAVTPGDVTVEARGFYVDPIVVGADVVAGTEVGIDSGGLLAPAGVGVSTIGIALMAGLLANNDVVDVLVR